MNAFERVSGSLAHHLAGKLGMDERNRDVLAYGAYSIIYTAWSMLLIAATGLFLGTLTEIMVLSTAASLLRRYSGGAHATSANRCAWTGVAIFGPLSLAVKFFGETCNQSLILFFIVSYGIARYWTWRHAPVDTPSKPIRDVERRKRFKIISCAVIDVCFAAIAMVAIVGKMHVGEMGTRIIVSVAAGLLWQAFTLTKYGNKLICFFDMKFTYGGRGKYEEE